MGNVWAADYGWTVLSRDMTNYGTSAPVANTTPDMYPLYRSHRYNHWRGTFRYSFAGIPAGKYNVTLKWSEVDSRTYDNMLDVAINGLTVLQNFNPTQHAGRVQTAIDRTFQAVITDGTIQIDFTASPAAGYVGATINGIEIVPAR